MSLLNKASIITTPTAYAEDFLYNIKPAGGLGDELVTNGDFDDGLNGWSSHSGSTLELEDGRAKVTTVGNQGWIKRNDLSIQSGKTYFCKAEITNALQPAIFINGTANQLSPTPLISGNLYGGYITTTGNNSTFYIRGNNTDGEVSYIDNVSIKEVVDFDFTRASTGTRVNEDYLIETVATNTPRIDYTNGEPSILLEPSRTNSITYTAGAYTFSGFLKKGTSNFAGIRAVINSFSNRFFANLDLTTGEITSTNTLGSGVTWSYGVEEYANGWFRLYISASHTSGNLDISFGLSNSASPSYSVGFPTYTGSTSNFVYAYGFQVEAGSYATSLIHTSGSAVTRSADAANNAGNSDLFNDSEGVLYCEIQALAADSTNRYIALSDGTLSNRINIFFDASNVLRGFVTGISSMSTSATITHFNKIALKYKSGDIALWLNGSEVGTRTNSISLSGLNTVDFDNGGGSIFYGNVKMVAVFKEALTDTELECLTSSNDNEIFLNYYNRMEYINATTEAMVCAQKTYTI
jgi:hypothetical protein